MKPILVIAFVLIATAAYIASPFATAWRIREAVRNGNADYLSTAVEWPTVRETLKPSIAHIALNLPETASDTSSSAGLWTRFKAYVGQSAVDGLVERYVTPEGLPQLFTLRSKYRDLIASEADDAKTLPVMDRIARAWARVKRAEFTGATSFEIDMEDKFDPTRIYLGKLELRPTGWKLTELRIRFLTTAKATVLKLTVMQ